MISPLLRQKDSISSGVVPRALHACHVCLSWSGEETEYHHVCPFQPIQTHRSRNKGHHDLTIPVHVGRPVILMGCRQILSWQNCPLYRVPCLMPCDIGGI